MKQMVELVYKSMYSHHIKCVLFEVLLKMSIFFFSKDIAVLIEWQFPCSSFQDVLHFISTDRIIQKKKKKETNQKENNFQEEMDI